MLTVGAALNVFFFNDTATTEIYTLSLHDALPIGGAVVVERVFGLPGVGQLAVTSLARRDTPRSEEHTSELQSRQYIVCRLLLEKKKVQLVRTPLMHINEADEEKTS